MAPSPDPIARLTATGHPWSVHYNPHASHGPAYVVSIGGATGGGRTLEDAIGAALDRLAGRSTATSVQGAQSTGQVR